MVYCAPLVLRFNAAWALTYIHTYDEYYVSSPPNQNTPTICQELSGAQIYSGDTFLGIISKDPYSDDSIADKYGPYGSTYQQTSIFHAYGPYGSKWSSSSAFNSTASNPPQIRINGIAVAYLTVNPIKTPRVDSYFVALCVDRSADAPR